jgi:hypothetical protein
MVFSMHIISLAIKKVNSHYRIDSDWTEYAKGIDDIIGKRVS